MRKTLRALTYVVTAGAALGIGAAIGSAGSSPSRPAAVAAVRPAATSPAAPTTNPATSAPPAPAPAVPSPGGTYNGACSYTLGSDPVGGTAVATGDVDITNTGNIGGVYAVAITWPQQGYSPLKMTRTVQVPAGGENDVQFHMSLTQDQLSNLQNWQTGHNYADGCTYDATLTSTYGNVQP